MRRGRARVTDEHRVGSVALDRSEGVTDGLVGEIRVVEHDLVARVEERPSDREEPERRQVIAGDTAAPDGRVRRVEEYDSHAFEA